MRGIGPVSAQDWAAAHQQLRVTEKEVMRAHDALAAQRRRMPWLLVEKNYQFDGPDGKVDLLDLFQGRRQLLVYRAFVGPDIEGWPDRGCRGCSMIADHIGIHHAFIIPVLCYLFIAYYGLKGSKIIQPA